MSTVLYLYRISKDQTWEVLPAIRARFLESYFSAHLVSALAGHVPLGDSEDDIASAVRFSTQLSRQIVEAGPEWEAELQLVDDGACWWARSLERGRGGSHLLSLHQELGLELFCYDGRSDFPTSTATLTAQEIRDFDMAVGESRYLIFPLVTTAGLEQLAWEAMSSRREAGQGNCGIS